jgi:hypothetical protein
MSPLIRAMLCTYLALGGTGTPSLWAQAKYVVLRSGAVDGIISHEGTWAPQKSDITELEASITQVSKLQIEGFISALHIEYPGSYFRQYVPVVLEGRKLFYVSAFCGGPPPKYWHRRLYVVSDGGACFWQAFYDPALKKYFHLTINPRG